MKYRLVLFDVDSTLIEQEVIDLLGARASRGEEVSRITAQAMAGELNFRMFWVTSHSRLVQSPLSMSYAVLNIT
jgi:phosphoserine phosphatase